MTKNHIKRLATPSSWSLKRKENKYITRPLPGAHNLRLSISLTMFLRDLAGVASTAREVRYLLNEKTTEVNGRQVKEVKYPVGLLDVITIKEAGLYFRVILNKQGKLVAKQISDKDALVILKIQDKRIIKGGKVQLNFSNGNNIIVDKDDYKTSDSVIVDGSVIKEKLEFKKGSILYLIGGGHKGSVVPLEDISGDNIIYKTKDNKVVETKKRYAFVVGTKKSLIAFD